MASHGSTQRSNSSPPTHAPLRVTYVAQRYGRTQEPERRTRELPHHAKGSLQSSSSPTARGHCLRWDAKRPRPQGAVASLTGALHKSPCTQGKSLCNAPPGGKRCRRHASLCSLYHPGPVPQTWRGRLIFPPLALPALALPQHNSRVGENRSSRVRPASRLARRRPTATLAASNYSTACTTHLAGPEFVSCNPSGIFCPPLGD